MHFTIPTCGNNRQFTVQTHLNKLSQGCTRVACCGQEDVGFTECGAGVLIFNEAFWNCTNSPQIMRRGGDKETGACTSRATQQELNENEGEWEGSDGTCPVLVVEVDLAAQGELHGSVAVDTGRQCGSGSAAEAAAEMCRAQYIWCDDITDGS